MDGSAVRPLKQETIPVASVPGVYNAAVAQRRGDVQGDMLFPIGAGAGGIVFVVPNDSGDPARLAYAVLSDFANGAATIQRGTAFLSGAGGVSPPIPATITATSRIIAMYKNPPAAGANTVGHLVALSADRVIGSPGSFIVRALDPAGAPQAAFAGAAVSFDWEVIN